MMFKQSLSWSTHRAGRSAWRRMIAAVAMIVLLGACDTGGGLRITAEADEPHFRRGLQMARSGQNQIALEAFLKVIEKRGGDAPESHFEAGQIYLNHIRDPIAAIYHYRKYLELRPNSPQAPQVWQLIDTGKKQFAATLAAEPLGQQFERLDLLDALEKLKAENTSLRSEISKLGKQPPSPMSITQSRPAAAGSPSEGSFNDPFANAAVQPVVPIETPAMEQRAEPQRPANSAADRPGGRTYTVLAKDTLYGISVKFYGSGNRWQSIMQANSDVLRSSADLKPGMVLRIP